MNKVVLGVLSLGLAALLGVACGGESSSEESGESHFLAFCDATCAPGLDCVCGVCTARCSSADECGEHAAGAVCVSPSCGQGEPVCEVACKSNAGCATLGSAYRCVAGACRAGEPPSGNEGGPPPDPVADCPAECQVLEGTPEASEGGCVDSAARENVACGCGMVSRTTACFVRVRDGSLWRVQVAESFALEEWVRSDEAQEARVQVSCDFTSCERPPESVCSVDETCEAASPGGLPGYCGGLVLDETGCRRADCEEDEDCGAEERCVLVAAAPYSCDRLDGEECACGSTSSVAFSPWCNPLEIAGPRGAWEQIEFLEVRHACTEDCVTIWTLTPDGAIEKAAGDTVETAELLATSSVDTSSFDFRYLVDGPVLRPGMRDGFDCGMTEDLDVTLRITLSGETYEQPVAGCIDGSDDNVVDQLARWVMKE